MDPHWRAKLPRPRLIKQWSEELTARVDYECGHCGTPIYAFSAYDRRVYAPSKDSLVIERVHTQPDCPR